MQDDLTKFSIGVALKDQESQTIAEAFVLKFICLYGLPQIVVTDQGSNFMSMIFRNVCKLLKIEKINSTA